MCVRTNVLKDFSELYIALFGYLNREMAFTLSSLLTPTYKHYAN